MSDEIEEKYVVFNKAKFDAWLDSSPYSSPNGRVEDAVVIREQDIFAGPALEMYSAAMTVALRVMVKDHASYARLKEIRDYFRRCADRSYEMATKMPD